MLKPLLRTIPTMSGNVKLACNLLDYNNTSNNVYETDVRYAKLLPISSTLYQKKIETQLLGSSWEYDLKKFYSVYNDVFFEPYFKYNAEEILKIDKTQNQYVRNSDFEMGTKRISYIKNGMQFAFFAPFYFEGLEDLPSYFNIDVNIHTTVHSVKKRIIVNITRKNNSKTNYLYHYLTKYAKSIDSNVCFMLPNSKQASYYGIDLIRGGFIKAIDNGISNIFNTQTTINNIDATICTGFRRNKIAMKQVMPLSFYFNVRDIMTPSELKLYRNAEIEISGYYVKSDIPLPWYDFSIDYDFWKESILRLNNNNGLMNWIPGKLNNIMDASFPSLNDMRYIKYQFSNKLTSTYCRWKLKYSNDEHPYITNISPAFSKNQESNYKYGQYPVSFSSMDGLALPYQDKNKRYYYNLIFPLSTNTKYYNLYNSNSTPKYRNIFNNYCLNWFNVIDKIDDSLFHRNDLWGDVVDNCIYYNGILYDLTNIYSELVEPEKIDKFGVFVKLNTNFMPESEVSKLKFAEYTLDRQVVMKNIQPNALSNLQLLNWSIGDNAKNNYKNFLYNNEEYLGEIQNRANADSITFSNIFTYSENNTGNYIDFYDYGLDYYELNKYYDYNQTASYINYIREHFFDLYRLELNSTYKDNWQSEFEDIIKENAMSYMGVLGNPSSYMINSYELLPIGRSYDLSYFDGEYDHNYRNSYMYSYGYSYMLNLHEYVAYEHKFTDNTSYLGYYYKPIEGQKNEYGVIIPGTNDEYEYVATYLNVCNIDNYGIKNRSFTSYYNAYTKFSSTYFSSGKREYVHSLYGNTFYNWRTFLKFAYINTIAYEPFNATYLKTFCENNSRQDLYNYNWITEPGHTSYKLWKSCQNVQAIAASAVLAYLKTKSQYIFKPIIDNNGLIYTSNVFKECLENTGKFYGAYISYSQLPKDKDVIYADRYNLNAIMKKYTGLKTYTSNDINNLYSYNWAITYETIYDIENSTYKSTYIKYTNIPEIITYNYSYNGNVEYYSFNDKDYTEFYAKFLNKKHIYYWYGELSKNEALKYPDNWAIDWKKNIFIKRRVLVHTNDGLKVKDEYIPLVDAGYMFINRVDQEWFLSFKKFYANIESNLNGLFYFNGNEGEKFELVYKDIFFRVNKVLWDIIGCENEEFYKDLYLYRIEHTEEYFTNYNTNDVHMRFVGNKFYNSYEGYYSNPDSSLVPLFYDIFEKDESEEAIGANYQLNNITPIDFAWPEYDEKKENIIKWHFGRNYRYNANNSLYMVSITNEEREWLGIDKTYEKYNFCSSELSIDKNDLNYNKDLYMSTYRDPHNGLKYGFYVIQANIDNTSNSFRVDTQTSLTSKSLIEEKYEYINNIKSIFYINGVKITEKPDYFTIIFKNVAPFLNINLLENLNKLSTIIKPNVFSIDMIYNQQLIDNTNNSTEINIYKGDSFKYEKQSLYRYTHNIVPLITECNMINNYYYLKLKNIDKTILDTGKFNSIGDSILYKKNIQINSFTPHNVYTLSPNEKEIKSYNNIDYKYTPLEYKHFNASKMINIEPSIILNLDGKYTYDELIKLQKDEIVIEKFKGYMNIGRVNKFDDNEILFLFNKYKVEYDSKSVGLNYNRTQKLYTLTYKFSLL